MLIYRVVWAASAAVALCASVASAQAKESCEGRISRSNVVQYVLDASLHVRAERQGIEVWKGRQQIVDPLLPSNPVLALSGAKRVSAQADATNWYASLAQELEVGGQRGARQRAVGHGREAQTWRVAKAERDTAAEAWRVYFVALAARDELRLATRLETTFASAITAVKAAAASGLTAGIDVDVAEAAYVRLARVRILAARRFSAAVAVIAAQLGLDPATHSPELDGELEPLRALDRDAKGIADSALLTRPELAEKRAERSSLESSADVYRRSRAPNVTVSVIAQRDGFAERVLGAGLSIPVPLPAPLGRTFAGHIAESEALVRRSTSELEGGARTVRLEVVLAQQDFAAAQETRALFTEERIGRAEQSLQAIAEAIANGKVAIGSVLLAQQSLIELLGADVDAKLSLCVASVALRRAAGLVLTGGTL